MCKRDGLLEDVIGVALMIIEYLESPRQNPQNDSHLTPQHAWLMHALAQQTGACSNENYWHRYHVSQLPFRNLWTDLCQLAHEQLWNFPVVEAIKVDLSTSSGIPVLYIDAVKMFRAKDQKNLVFDLSSTIAIT